MNGNRHDRAVRLLWGWNGGKTWCGVVGRNLRQESRTHYRSGFRRFPSRDRGSGSWRQLESCGLFKSPLVCLGMCHGKEFLLSFCWFCFASDLIGFGASMVTVCFTLGMLCAYRHSSPLNMLTRVVPYLEFLYFSLEGCLGSQDGHILVFPFLSPPA